MGKCGFVLLKQDRDGCHQAYGLCELAMLYAKF